MNHCKQLIAATVLGIVIAASAAAITPTFESRGIGGGGALFAPSFSPFDEQTIHVACDMSQVFRTTNFGASWETMPFGRVTGNRESRIQHSSDPQVLYTIDYSLDNLVDASRVKKSTNGGLTWQFLPSDPTGGEVYYLAVDPTSTERLLITSYNTLYISLNGGSTFSPVHTNNDGNGVLLAGAWFDGNDIHVGTNVGLLVSANGGASFSLGTMTGIPSGDRIISFCAAEEGATTRLVALTATSAWAGIMVEDHFWEAKKVYTLDVGAGSWVERSGGLPTVDGNALAHVACARNDVDTLWAAGQKPGELPMIYRSTNGGVNWTDVLLIANNQNTITGWAGHQGDRQWSYGGGATGFAVHPLNANIAAFSDYGFVHLTANGGTMWRQAYVNQADENPAGSATPKNRSYHGVGLENTTNWRLTWLGNDVLWACFSDIRGTRSLDNGASWSFNYTGHTANSSYDCIHDSASGTAYLATGTAHDLYQTTTLQDSPIDAATGAVLFSTDNAATWQVLRNFGKMVWCLKFDPSVPERMYAGVVHGNGGNQSGSQGGFWVTNNRSAGAGATWTQLAHPPRTQGHPIDLDILSDGTLVATYTARRTGSGFTQSSGVFVSDDGGSSWEDRSHANMTYYVKDLVVDPADATESTWYASVWSGWGGPFATNNDAGGLYRTTDRGVNWTRILHLHRVSSITILPSDGNRAFVTTEAEGLLYTDTLQAVAPAFDSVTTFPFRQPERVYVDPNDSNRIWVTSFGGGTRTALLDSAPTSVVGWINY